MRIKRLDIVGFKSFPERTQIPFPEGISAVVGPNGCGKSNIVDAIRWVMGEQSAKQLRGRSMEDVLFNGAKDHPPAGMAEVTLVLSNENGFGQSAKSLGPTEISITRRLYRSGDSDFLINKVPCRLKDISQFFMDTGMGTKAYAIIEQGRIGWLVDARPEDRRSLIDEAAGITRYKAQKREAERKIEATEQNLTHITALMSETKRQINTITRAARKAQRYKELRAELKETDLILTGMELAGLDDKRRELAGQYSEAEAQLNGLLAQLEKVEVELEQARLDIVEKEKEAEAKGEKLHELEKKYNSLRQEEEYLARQEGEHESRRERMQADLKRLADQKEGLAAELARLEEERSGLAAKVEEGRRAREEVRGEVDGLRQEYGRAASGRDEIARRLSETRTRQGRLEENLSGLEQMFAAQAVRREELSEESSRLKAESVRLENHAAELAGEREEALGRVERARQRAEQTEKDLAGLHEESERLTAREREFDSTLAGLTSRLNTLKDIKADFGWYPQAARAVMSDESLAEAGVLGPAAEFFSVPEGYEKAVEAALGERLGFVLVRDRSAASAALDFLAGRDLGRCGFICLDALPPGAENDLTRALLGEYILADSLAAAPDSFGRAVLTRKGEYQGPGGVVVGGTDSGEDEGLLARLKDIEVLESKTAELAAEKERLAESLRGVKARLEENRSLLGRSREAVRSAEAALVETDKKISTLAVRREETESRLASAARSFQSLDAEAERLEEQKQSISAERESLEADEFDLTADLEKAEEAVAAAAAELEAAREREHQASLEERARAERLGTAEREASRTREWLRDLETQRTNLEGELKQTGEEQVRIGGRRREIAEQLDGSDEILSETRGEVDQEKRRVDEMRSALNAKENEARAARRRRSEIDDRVRKLELELQENDFRRQALLDRIMTDYKLDLTDLPEEEKPDAAEDFDEAEARARRDDLRSKIESMGEVNLTAIGEHEALQERYDFYKSQVDDLNSSIENLRNSITRINRTCKIRFASTFKAVDEKLREIFPLLFEGGEAWLSLTDDSDPLESGVEIHVHPPGKKLTVMSLLSGGEKALVALALIFALYLIKPSPFCLLDETDAPLDEANIDRFNRLLQKLGQSSQIIMVTHNKRTMQISETLYGVTMEVPGISKMVGVNLSEAEDLLEDDQMVQTG